MPIYEYKCKRCTHKFEVIQKIGAPTPEMCPNCKRKDTLKRLVSKPSLRFVGGGWYKPTSRLD